MFASQEYPEEKSLKEQIDSALLKLELAIEFCAPVEAIRDKLHERKVKKFNPTKDYVYNFFSKLRSSGYIIYNKEKGFNDNILFSFKKAENHNDRGTFFIELHDYYATAQYSGHKKDDKWVHCLIEKKEDFTHFIEDIIENYPEYTQDFKKTLSEFEQGNIYKPENEKFDNLEVLMATYIMGGKLPNCKDKLEKFQKELFECSTCEGYNEFAQKLEKETEILVNKLSGAIPTTELKIKESNIKFAIGNVRRSKNTQKHTNENVR